MAGQASVDFTWGHANQGGQHDWPFVMALQKGFFLEEGINLQIQVIPGGDALAQASDGAGRNSGRQDGKPAFSDRRWQWGALRQDYCQQCDW